MEKSRLLATIWRSYRYVWAISGVLFAALWLVSYSVNGPDYHIIWPGNALDNMALIVYGLTFLGLLILFFKVRGWYKFLPVLGIPIFGIATFALAILLDRFTSYELDRVELSDGRIFILTSETTFPDFFYGLWQFEKGWIWRQTPLYVNYLDTGRFAHDQALIVSADERYMLVRRGGIWTECYTLNPLKPCFVQDHFLTQSPVEKWYFNSERIKTLTGLSPDT